MRALAQDLNAIVCVCLVGRWTVGRCGIQKPTSRRCRGRVDGSGVREDHRWRGRTSATAYRTHRETARLL